MQELVSSASAIPGAERFDWQTSRPVSELSRNPCHPPDDPVLLVYYDDGVPVAGIEMVRDQVVIEGRVFEWMWVGNQLTLKSHRGRGIMPKLIREILRLGDERRICVGGAGVMPAGRATYAKAGLSFWGKAPRQTLALRANAFFRHFLKSPVVSDIGAAPFNLLLNAGLTLVRLSLLPAASRFQLDVSDDFDVDVEPLFESIPQSPRFSRNLEKMRWRWQRVLARRDAPKRDYRLGYLRRADDGTLAGFFMLRLTELDRPGGLPADKFRIVTVIDWCTPYRDARAQKALVCNVIKQAGAMNGEAIEFSTTDASLQRILRSRGFVALSGFRLFFHGAKGTPLEGKAAENVPDWWWNGADPEDVYTW